MTDALLELPSTNNISSESGKSLVEILQTLTLFVRRYSLTIGVTTLATLGFAFVYLSTATPTYTAAATLILDMRNVLFTQQKSMVTDIALDSAFVESQVEVFKSKSVLSAVIDKLQLLQNPEFVGSTGGLIGDLGQAIGRRLNTVEPPSEFELRERTVRAMEGRLGVKRVGLSFIIEVSFRSIEADLAARVVNAVAEAYLADAAGARVQAARRATVWLQESLKELRDQTIAADRALVEFKIKNNIINAGGRLINEQQLVELNTQLVNATAQKAEAQARLDSITKILSAASPNSDAFVPAVTDSLRSDVINKLRTEYLDIAHREADWSGRYGFMHSAAIHLRDQMREIRSSIIDELGRITTTYRSELDVAKQREESAKGQLSDVISNASTSNEAQVTMRELESAAQTYRTLYDDFRHRELETLQQQTFPMTEGRILSAASKPLRVSWPRASVVILAALIGGLALGILLSLVRDLTLALRRGITHAKGEAAQNGSSYGAGPGP
jgi:succinoglycan biosynthesis transport protein ExoP